jgi:hypothetical protein
MGVLVRSEKEEVRREKGEVRREKEEVRSEEWAVSGVRAARAATLFPGR